MNAGAGYAAEHVSVLEIGRLPHRPALRADLKVRLYEGPPLRNRRAVCSGM